LIVLDTNVLSELMRNEPSVVVVEWVDAQLSSDLMITSITAAELRAGAALLPAGRRRTRIIERVDAIIDETFDGYVLAFDADSADPYAEIVARRTKSGSPMATPDAQIAAICLQYAATLATRNIRDFVESGVDLVNPWRAAIP
jgi:predicted nucleic acid-binding protein